MAMKESQYYGGSMQECKDGWESFRLREKALREKNVSVERRKKGVVTIVINDQKISQKLSRKALAFAYNLFREQVETLGLPTDPDDPENLEEWLLNRRYSMDVLEDAANGIPSAIHLVRWNAGLPPLDWNDA